MTDHASDQTKRIERLLAENANLLSMEEAVDLIHDLSRSLDALSARLAAPEPRPAPADDWRPRCTVMRMPDGRWDVRSLCGMYWLAGSWSWHKYESTTEAIGWFSDESSARAALASAPPYPGAEREPTPEHELSSPFNELVSHLRDCSGGCPYCVELCQQVVDDARPYPGGDKPPPLKVGDVLPATEANAERVPVGARAKYNIGHRTYYMTRDANLSHGRFTDDNDSGWSWYGVTSDGTLTILSLPAPALDPADVEAVAEAGGMSHAMVTAALRTLLARGWTPPKKGARP